jgi:hypothetical protein
MSVPGITTDTHGNRYTARQGPARPCSSKPSDMTPSPAGAESPGSASKRSACSCAATGPTTPSPAPSAASCAPTSSLDDIGLLPVGTDAAEGLYRLVDAAYEKRSVAVSSNLHPSGFDEIMPKTLAGATVDRLLHHAHLCNTTGDSIRLAQATTGKGVIPLTP